MEKIMHKYQKCSGCEKTYPLDKHILHCACGAMLEICYEPVKPLNLKNWIDKSLKGVWRYWHLLPLVKKENIIYCHEGLTPLYKSKYFVKRHNYKNVWLKDETKNPTKTFKDRESGVSISRFKELGINKIAVCSTGNTATAFSNSVLKSKEMVLKLLIPKDCRERITFKKSERIKIVYYDGNYHEALKASNGDFLLPDFIPEGGFANPGRIEGVKTLAFEVAEEGLAPDYFLQTIGSGVGPYAVCKGFKELMKIGFADKMPKFICIQPEKCAPMVNAYRAGASKLTENFFVENPHTVVTTVANGKPAFSYPYLRKIVKETGGDFISVSEKEIIQAQNDFCQEEGVNIEPAAACTIAGLEKLIKLNNISGDILVNLSGAPRGTK